jgi:IS5 family transposase
MTPSRINTAQSSLFFSLTHTLDQKHPLYILANTINWNLFEDEFAPLYCKDNGRPAKPIRLMVGLLLLKHIRNISDESVVEQWCENVYYQYFCGYNDFTTGHPCNPTELVHFRHRIGEKGIELILKESIRINGKDGHAPNISVDTTVQEKNITFPTDDKLYKKIIKRCHKLAEAEEIELRQSYKRTLKQLSYDQRYRSHPRNKAKARKADKKVKTIAGRLVRDIERKLAPSIPKHIDLAFYKQVLAQKRNDKNKIYSLHEPEVCCISKGKDHKKYEFGNKVSLSYTQNTGVIVGAKSFRNEYDGNTLETALEQVVALTGNTPKTATVDRGYRGKNKIGNTEIQIPNPAKDKKRSRYQQNKKRKACRRRAAIEPVIGHLKADHRLSRNFYHKIFGDNINVMLAAAAYNFKRMINIWKKDIFGLIQTLVFLFKNLKNQYIMQGEKWKVAF